MDQAHHPTIHKTDWRPVGILGVVAGCVSCVGLIGPIAPLFISPLGIICGVVAIRTGHKKLGWASIILSCLGILISVGISIWLLSSPQD